MTVQGQSRQSRPEKLVKLARAFATDPVGVTRALPGEYRQTRGIEQYATSQIDEEWNEHLHALLGAPWPCPLRAGLDDLMADVSSRLTSAGLGFGRGTYGWYSDAEISLCQAVWCTVLHRRPDAVIETGVAHGVTSRIVLEALNLNARGRLWSIDLPHPLDHALHTQTGAAVTDSCRERWTYVKGSSRQRLRSVIGEVGQVQLFIHDSLHTSKNTLFEMEQVSAAMSPGGVMVVDDIKSHDGFASFADRHRNFRTIVCPSKDRVGLFGIAVREALD